MVFRDSPPPPPLLNQRKYVVLSMNSSKVTAVAAKRYATVQKHLEFFQRRILAVKTLVIGTVSW